MEISRPDLDEIASQLIDCFGAPTGRLSDDDLLKLAAAAERLARVIGAAQTRLAGEIGSRSRPELGDEGLSRSQNFATPVKLLAAVTKVAPGEARRRLGLGARLRGAELLGGAVGTAPYPLVSAAMARGDLSVETAGVISRECAGLAQRGVDPSAVGAAEETLVDSATDPALTADDIARLAVRIRETLDPDGLEPRAEAQHEARSLTLARSSDGMYRGRIALAPDAAAVWINTLQALITPRAAPRFVSEDDYVEQAITADTRTGPQKMADAATEVFSRVAASPDTPRLAGATTTVNVHVTVTDLERGSGPGWVDGLDEPVPMSVVARLRCTSPIVTTVFGDRGEVLHHGKARRLFTGAQNRALAARDGGCVWPGCDRPPSWCETHHVDEWMSHSHPPGRTDIDNGVLLCRFHHSHLHKSSWRLVMSDGVPHVVPPRWIDVSQTPIRVTRRRTLPAARSGAPTAGGRPQSHGFDPPPRHASPDHDAIRNTDARGSG